MRRGRPTVHSMSSISTKAEAIKTPDTAATRTSRVDSIMPHMRNGNVSARALDRNSDTGTLSIEALKARNAPAAVAGEAEGGKRRQHNAEQRRDAGNLERIGGGAMDLARPRGIEQLLVPGEGEALGREFQRLAFGERGREHDDDRRHDDEHGEDR